MRFPNVYEALAGLRRSQNPAHQSEAAKAMQMIWGKRPGIEEKYDELLVKLDRTYSQMADYRDAWKKTAEESTMYQKRMFAQSKVKALNKILTDITWMKARNKDLIAAIVPAENAK